MFTPITFAKILVFSYIPENLVLKSPPCPVPFCLVFCFSSIYSSDEEDEDLEVYDHDYDGLLAKGGKRHLGKTRWTREEVKSSLCLKKREM